jgi:hypothetical protein
MAKTREAFTTPVGRLVQGDAFVAQTKDQQGNLRVVKTGPNAGQPAPQFFVAVAFPKMNPRNPAVPNAEIDAFRAMLDRVARAEWPHLFPTPGGPCVNPLFTIKVKDGDGVDRQGKSNAEKEGFAGHWVVSFASSYAPKVVQSTSPGVWATLTDPASVKRGYYVRVAGSTSSNDNAQNPGLYVNLDMIELVAYGPEIVSTSGPDAAIAFAAPAVLPVGASTTPLASSGAMPGAALPPPGYTGHLDPAVAAVTAPPPPATSAALPPPPPSAEIAMTAAANGITYAGYIAGGWTHAQLVEKGMIA